MDLIILVKLKHPKYRNKWDSGQRLKSITTEPDLGQRLTTALTNSETIKVYDPSRNICFTTKVLETNGYDFYWEIHFDFENQTPSSKPNLVFTPGVIGADLDNGKISKLYKTA